MCLKKIIRAQIDDYKREMCYRKKKMNIEEKAKKQKQSDKQMMHVSDWRRKRRMKYVGRVRKREQKQENVSRCAKTKQD